MADATPLSATGGERSFQLPVSATSAFPAMFAELEGRQGELSIDSYGISMTTLEQVFLNLAAGKGGLTAGADVDADVASGDGGEGGEGGGLLGPASSEGGRVGGKVGRSFWRSWKEMFRKRMIIGRRDVKVKAERGLWTVDGGEQDTDKV